MTNLKERLTTANTILGGGLAIIAGTSIYQAIQEPNFRNMAGALIVTVISYLPFMPEKRSSKYKGPRETDLRN